MSKTKATMFLLTAVFVFILAFATACDQCPPQGCNYIEPEDTQTPIYQTPVPTATADISPEARIRYIIADIQLGDVADYYRTSMADPVIAEALRRWDTGIRVTNINEFERKIVGDKGWQIVYIGTENLVNGMDIILSEPQTSNACGNSYWPIVMNAEWIFENNITWTIIEVRRLSSNSIWFSVAEGGDVQYIQNYSCDESGIYHVEGDFHKLILPAESNLFAGYQYSSNSTYHFLSIESVVGDTITLTTDEGFGGQSLQFTKGIGPTSVGSYSGDGSYGPFRLISYVIP
ncbi:MAG: hypothetical protein HY869_02230 [Chloroflexi bacterium]|nr:hypothetical protein [Chloroflexota bacterium]